MRLGETISIDCRLSDAEAVSAYSRALRQDIARARRAGLRTELDSDWAHLETFVQLYSSSMTAKAAPAPYWVRASDIRRMRDELSGQLHLFVTHVEGRVIGAGIFSEHLGFVEAIMVGTDESVRRWSPLKVMLDDVRRWAHARGATTFHIGSGRGGRRDSLFEFKSRFSRGRHDLWVAKWVLDPVRYRGLTTSRARRLAEYGLHMADPSWFPAYRSPVTTYRADAGDGRSRPGAVRGKDTREQVTIPIARERVMIPIAREHFRSPADQASRDPSEGDKTDGALDDLVVTKLGGGRR